VILELSEEALAFGRTAHRALEAAGGDELAVRAEQDPEKRGALVEPTLGDLGAWELDVRRSTDELEAAAALCRSAGWWAVAYPVAERLARPLDFDADVDGLVVVSNTTPSAPVFGLDARWGAVTVDGNRHLATPRPLTTSVRKAAYVTGLDLEPASGDGFLDLALGLVLPCWTLLGMLDRAMVLTRSYVLEREQFGQPIGRFQGVQFQLTDAEVERVGLEELAKYALWSVEIGSDDAVVDALALRAAAIEAADLVLRVAHQLHGAIGFCDETFLSWLSRASVPLRRLPLNLAGTRAELARHLGRRGLTGIFSGAFG
jgi:hypothetical protein